MGIHNLRVQDIMRTDVTTIDGDTDLLEAARLMYETGLSSLVITPRDDRDAFGIITRKDILEALLMEGREELAPRVADMMTKPAITVGPRLSIENCLLLMRTAGARRLPVVENEQLVGIITSTDVFSRLVGTWERMGNNA